MSLSNLILILTSVLIVSCQGKVIVNESFDYPDGDLPGNWWSEGCPGEIKDGKLFVNADTVLSRMSTIWLDKQIEGNLSVEFDVRLISSEGSKNNINCFLLYSDPSGKSLKETKENRKVARYGSYRELNGYIITFLANGNEDKARVRFRYNPGFRLLQENFGYNCRKGETYHIKILKNNNNLQYWVDENKMIDKELDPEQIHHKGLFGFRTWHTCLEWDNLLIKKLD